jgi:hypothetical protein
MTQTPDVPDVMWLPPVPARPPGRPGPARRRPLVIGLTLLAISVALVVFLTLVVIPAAGAAGGCGGG